MELAFRILLPLGPLTLLAAVVGTISLYWLYPRQPASGRGPGLLRYLLVSAIAAAVGYGAGTAAGIAITCSTPEGGNLCGLMGVLGLGPLLAGVSMFAAGWYQVANSRSTGNP